MLVIVDVLTLISGMALLSRFCRWAVEEKSAVCCCITQPRAVHSIGVYCHGGEKALRRAVDGAFIVPTCYPTSMGSAQDLDTTETVSAMRNTL